MRIVGYVRVSTDEQTNGAEAQRLRLEQKAKEEGWELHLVTEHASGKTLARRPLLKRSMERLDAHEFDGLVVVKLDRLARSVLDFASIIQRSTANDWALICLDLSLDTSTPNGRFTAHVLAAVAQLERDLISQRTREALAVVRSRGVQLGQPSTVPKKVSQRIKDLRERGESWRGISGILNTAGVPGPGGGVWLPTSTRRVYLRGAQ